MRFVFFIFVAFSVHLNIFGLEYNCAACVAVNRTVTCTLVCYIFELTIFV